MKKNLLSMCIAASLLAGTILTPAGADVDKSYETVPRGLLRGLSPHPSGHTATL